MPDMTAQQVITAAYRKIGITVTSSSTTKLASGLEDLQNMLSLWSTRGLLVPNNVTETLTLTSGQAVYTIGEDGSPDFDTVRPVKLISGFIRISNNDYPVNVDMTEREYNMLLRKDTEARPRAVYYDPQYPNGKLKFDYEADAALAFHLTSEKILTNPTAQSTTFSIPLEYNEAMVYNLALRLTSDNNTAIHPSVAVHAEESLATIEKYNSINVLSDAVPLDNAVVGGYNAGYGMDYKRGF